MPLAGKSFGSLVEMTERPLSLPVQGASLSWGFPNPRLTVAPHIGLKHTFQRSEWHFAELALSGNDSLLEASRHTL